MNLSLDASQVVNHLADQGLQLQKWKSGSTKRNPVLTTGLTAQTSQHSKWNARSVDVLSVNDVKSVITMVPREAVLLMKNFFYPAMKSAAITAVTLTGVFVSQFGRTDASFPNINPSVPNYDRELQDIKDELKEIKDTLISDIKEKLDDLINNNINELLAGINITRDNIETIVKAEVAEISTTLRTGVAEGLNTAKSNMEQLLKTFDTTAETIKVEFEDIIKENFAHLESWIRDFSAKFDELDLQSFVYLSLAVAAVGVAVLTTLALLAGGTCALLSRTCVKDNNPV
nr:hypothetical protein [Endozoicomonas sp.]